MFPTENKCYIKKRRGYNNAYRLASLSLKAIRNNIERQWGV